MSSFGSGDVVIAVADGNGYARGDVVELCKRSDTGIWRGYLLRHGFRIPVVVPETHVARPGEA